jgi:hypothetical protein
MTSHAERYKAFLESKAHRADFFGFEPTFMPPMLFDFQKELVAYATRKGRSAIFADCGLGKTPMQLTVAQNIVEHTNGRVLILAPLAVAPQTVLEGEKFGIEVKHSRDGVIGGAGVYITNYERLQYFNPTDFVGVVCDESSAIKAFSGKRRKEVTRFMAKHQYRLLCTATAAPNDFIELGTSSEALGVMGQMDMLSMFFKSTDDMNHVFFKNGDFWNTHKWTLKPHAEENFWKWVCSWARAIRKPSDLGFDDGNFKLPPLNVEQHEVADEFMFPGEFLPRIAVTMNEQREERRMSMDSRCGLVSDLVKHKDPAVVWCHLNEEGDRLEKCIDGSKQVKGSMTDEEKEETFLAFARGDLRVLITKPKIGAFGLNWQHCNHMTFFPSHSFEQYYQGVRRCWRFGQKKPVKVDIITTKGEAGVTGNLNRKAEQAGQMFENLVAHMNNAISIEKKNNHTEKEIVPSWL